MSLSPIEMSLFSFFVSGVLCKLRPDSSSFILYFCKSRFANEMSLTVIYFVFKLKDNTTTTLFLIKTIIFLLQMFCYWQIVFHMKHIPLFGSRLQ